MRAAIYLAIGIAQVGNSGSEFFLAPEVNEPLPEPDLPPGRAPREPAVKDAAADAAAPAKPAQSILDRASTVLRLS